MKRVGLRIVLALVIALTLVMGSVSVVSARPTAPNDTGYSGFAANYFYDENGTRWLIVFYDFNLDNDFYRDNMTVFIYNPTLGINDYADYYETITSNINWGQGIATFTSAHTNFTVTFDPREVTRITAREGLGIEYHTLLGGDTRVATISGSVIANSGTTYVLPSTTTSLVNVVEEHVVPLPAH